MKRRSDEEISAPLYAFDAEVRSQYGCFAGVDEAGRGPLAGPVVAAAVILDPARPIAGLNDSKKLSEKKRDALAELIREALVAPRKRIATRPTLGSKRRRLEAKTQRGEVKSMRGRIRDGEGGE